MTEFKLPAFLFKIISLMLFGCLALFSQSAFARVCTNGGGPISANGNGNGHTYTTTEIDHLPADGISANTVLVHISAVFTFNPCAGMPVEIGEAPDVDFGAGFGNTATCLATDANGNCRFNAVSRREGSFTYKTRAISSQGGDKFGGTVSFSSSLFISPVYSGIQVLLDNQIANSGAADILQANIRNSGNVPIPGIAVSFSGIGACITDGNGQCSVGKTSTTPGTYKTSASANKVGIGSASYSFVTGPAGGVHSTTRVVTDGQRADGSSADVLGATVRDSWKNPMPGVEVLFAGTPGVRLAGGSAGAAGSCTTDADGDCTLTATSTTAGRHDTAVTVNGASLKALRYSFVPGPAVATHSGVRVVTDNAVADGIDPDVLEVHLRDRFDNLVTADTNVDFSSPGGDISFDAGSRGRPGSCNTGTTGFCEVTVTTSDTAGGARNTVVTLAGVPLTGRFSVGAADYGPSPLRFRFAPWALRLQIVKRVLNGSGSHTFSFATTGLNAPTDSLTVVGIGTASGAHLLGSVPATPITITEVATPGWPDAPVSASCIDLDSADPTATFGTLVANRLLVPPGRSPAGANLVCSFVHARPAGLSGRVFGDTGIDGGVPNDGIANGGEAGFAGLAVTLGDCASTLYDSSTSDAAGRYSLQAPPAIHPGSPVCVEVGHTAGRQATGGSLGKTPLVTGTAVTVGGVAFTYRRGTPTDRVAFLWPAATVVNFQDLNFGSVPNGTLGQPALQNGRPGSTVSYAHAFVAGTGGRVGFSVPHSLSSPPTAGWSESVFADPACTGRWQPGADLLYPPAVVQDVTAGQQVCVVVRESIPAQAPLASRNRATLQADFIYAHASPALSATYVVDDLTTVSSEALALVKEVRNPSQGATDFGPSNQARPGDTLEYRITFTNAAPEPIASLVISDTTPAFTRFVSARAGTTPASLATCAKRTPASKTAVECAVAQPAGTGTGTTGPIEWRFTGPLDPGASGSVLFQVRLE